jgi:hypothetical protein
VIPDCRRVHGAATAGSEVDAIEAGTGIDGAGAGGTVFYAVAETAPLVDVVEAPGVAQLIAEDDDGNPEDGGVWELCAGSVPVRRIICGCRS